MDESIGNALPDSIKAAWGRHERPNRGPRPALSLERVVRGAVQVASKDPDLNALSMNRVAAELGVTTMALYRYVASKDELLQLMADAAYGQPEPAPEDDKGWRARLTRWAWGHLTVLRKHPWVLGVPVTGYPITPNQITWLEDGLSALSDTGLSQKDRLSVVLLLSGYVRIQAALSMSIDEGVRESHTSIEEATLAYGRLLEQLAEPSRFPALHAVIAAGVLEDPNDSDTEFVFGLERVLDGIEVLIRP